MKDKSINKNLTSVRILWLRGKYKGKYDYCNVITAKRLEYEEEAKIIKED